MTFIPYFLFPKHWGLQGKDRERARAKYNLSGEELDRELVKLDHYNKDTVEFKIANLDLDKKYNHISDNDYDKTAATIKGEPYFKVLTGDYKETGPDKGTMIFELDWNDLFVTQLEESGWNGLTSDIIVDAWFEDACKQMFIEDGMDHDFEDMPITSYNRTRRRPYKGDTTEYS